MYSRNKEKAAAVQLGCSSDASSVNRCRSQNAEKGIAAAFQSHNLVLSMRNNT